MEKHPHHSFVIGIPHHPYTSDHLKEMMFGKNESLFGHSCREIADRIYYDINDSLVEKKRVKELSQTHPIQLDFENYKYGLSLEQIEYLFGKNFCTNPEYLKFLEMCIKIEKGEKGRILKSMRLFGRRYDKSELNSIVEKCANRNNDNVYKSPVIISIRRSEKNTRYWDVFEDGCALQQIPYIKYNDSL